MTAVSEQQIQDTEKAYKNLSVLALGMFAGKNVQDLRNVTAFVEQGKESYTVDDFNTKQSDRSTSYAPDIFVDTVWINPVFSLPKGSAKTTTCLPSLKME